MGNLRRAPNYVLLNTVDTNTVKYVDKNGAITTNTALAMGLFIKDYGVIMGGFYHGYKCCYCPGVLQDTLINIKPTYPCDDCNGKDVGFTIFKEYVLTGIPKVPSNFYGLGKPYFWHIDEVLTSTSGYLDPIDIEKACSYLVMMINAPAMQDIGVSQYPVVTPYQRVRYEHATGNPTLIIKDICSGVNQTFTSTSASGLAAVINHTAGALITAIDWSHIHITIEGNAGVGFIATTLTNLTRDDDNYWVRLKQAHIESPFSIRALDYTGTQEELIAWKPAKLLSTDVARRFPILPLSHVGMQPTLPIKDAAYCEYYGRIFHKNTYDLVGANHLNDYYEEVYFYVLESQATTAYWDTKLLRVYNNVGKALSDFSTSRSTYPDCSCSSSNYSVSEGSISPSDIRY